MSSNPKSPSLILSQREREGEASDCNEHRFGMMDEVYLSLLRMNIYVGHHPPLHSPPVLSHPFYHFPYYRALQRIQRPVTWNILPFRPFAKTKSVYRRREGLAKCNRSYTALLAFAITV